jgi:hypothetical protein
MKMIGRFLSVLALLAVVLTIVGCKKEEPTMPTKADAEKAAGEAKDAADSAIDAAKTD